MGSIADYNLKKLLEVNLEQGERLSAEPNGRFTIVQSGAWFSGRRLPMSDLSRLISNTCSAKIEEIQSILKLAQTTKRKDLILQAERSYAELLALQRKVDAIYLGYGQKAGHSDPDGLEFLARTCSSIHQQLGNAQQQLRAIYDTTSLASTRTAPTVSPTPTTETTAAVSAPTASPIPTTGTTAAVSPSTSSRTTQEKTTGNIGPLKMTFSNPIADNNAMQILQVDIEKGERLSADANGDLLIVRIGSRVGRARVPMLELSPLIDKTCSAKIENAQRFLHIALATKSADSLIQAREFCLTLRRLQKKVDMIYQGYSRAAPADVKALANLAMTKSKLQEAAELMESQLDSVTQSASVGHLSSATTPSVSSASTSPSRTTQEKTPETIGSMKMTFPTPIADNNAMQILQVDIENGERLSADAHGTLSIIRIGSWIGGARVGMRELSPVIDKTCSAKIEYAEQLLNTALTTKSADSLIQAQDFCLTLRRLQKKVDAICQGYGRTASADVEALANLAMTRSKLQEAAERMELQLGSVLAQSVGVSQLSSSTNTMQQTTVQYKPAILTGNRDILPRPQIPALSDEYVTQLAHQLQTCRDLKELFSTIGNINEDFLEDPRIVTLLAKQPLVRKYLESVVRITSTVEHVPPTPSIFLGRQRVLQLELNMMLARSMPEAPLSQEEVKRLQKLTNAILRISQHSPLDKSVHSSVVIACRYLANHYRQKGIQAKADHYTTAPVQLQIRADNQFGQLDRLRSMAPRKVCWLHTDSTIIADGQVRVHIADDRSMHMSATMPRNAREEFGRSIERLKQISHPNAKISEGDSGYQSKDGTVQISAGKAFVITSANDKIVLKVGNDPKFWNQFEKIEIDIKDGVSAQELYEFLANIGLAGMLLDARPEDTMRQRLARLCASEVPALDLNIKSPERWAERGQSLGLQERALAMCPSSVQKPDLKEDVDPTAVAVFKQHGGAGFAATVGFNKTNSIMEIMQTWSFYTIDPAMKTAETLGYIIDGGFLSSIERFERGIVGKGCCPELNIRSGSANQVFTRILTWNQFLEGGYDWSRLAIPGSVLVLISPKAAERLPFAYPSDHAGLRSSEYRGGFIHMPQKEYPSLRLTGEAIKDRITIPQLAEQQQESGVVSPTAEVMFTQTLSVSYIVGFAVATSADRTDLLEAFRKAGKTTLNGRPIEQVVVVAPRLNAETQKLLEG